jgi:tRNA-2-methylthio-N6-dimethylallyladenosine synthase
MAGQVDEAVKSERLGRLQSLIEAQQRAFNAAQVDRALPILFEKPGRHPGQVIGRSPYLQAVHCEGAADLIGRIETVRIVDAAHNSLTARRAPAREIA